MDWTILLIILQLIVLEGLLSIDNAAVLGAMVSDLPDHIAVPWPKSLKKIGRSLHPLLGNQRTAALRVGLLGAYVGRGLMLLIASLIIQNPWLKILGAFYLIYLAFENLGIKEDGDEHDAGISGKQGSFWGVVVMIEVADLIFSLDNVVAAVSLSDKLWVVMVGVAIGILFMRFAAGIFSYAVEREPVLKSAAYILVLNIGLELLAGELTGFEFNDMLRFGISIGTIALSLLYAHWKALHFLEPVLHWLGIGFGNFAELLKWAVSPVLKGFSLVGRMISLAQGPALQPQVSDTPSSRDRQLD